MINDPKIKVVLDTNVLLSTIFFGGRLSNLISKAIEKEVELIFSPYILKELREILELKFNLPLEKIAPVLLDVINATTIVPTTGRLKGICRDPKDDQILETALNGKANYLVTGDKDLLALDKHKEIEIITPAKFLKVFKIKRE